MNFTCFKLELKKLQNTFTPISPKSEQNPYVWLVCDSVQLDFNQQIIKHSKKSWLRIMYISKHNHKTLNYWLEIQ